MSEGMPKFNIESDKKEGAIFSGEAKPGDILQKETTSKWGEFKSEVGSKVEVFFRNDPDTKYFGKITVDEPKGKTAFKLDDGREVDTSEVIYRIIYN